MNLCKWFCEGFGQKVREMTTRRWREWRDDCPPKLTNCSWFLCATGKSIISYQKTSTKCIAFVRPYLRGTVSSSTWPSRRSSWLPLPDAPGTSWQRVSARRATTLARYSEIHMKKWNFFSFKVKTPTLKTSRFQKKPRNIRRVLLRCNNFCLKSDKLVQNLKNLPKTQG